MEKGTESQQEFDFLKIIFFFFDQNFFENSKFFCVFSAVLVIFGTFLLDFSTFYSRPGKRVEITIHLVIVRLLGVKNTQVGRFSTEMRQNTLMCNHFIDTLT